MDTATTDSSHSNEPHSGFLLRQAATDAEIHALRIPVGTSLADAERWMIFATLRKCGGNKTRAAALLGVSLKTLYNRLNAYRTQGVQMDQGLQAEIGLTLDAPLKLDAGLETDADLRLEPGREQQRLTEYTEVAV